ncbi:glycosyltransferase family 2 protein [Kordia jejudonensis]|uniref:glycosyltransferase family 2 protein n=1 Tax=Kordia jejudonensis TaxID=1348245 RepID=UPI0006290C9F|nr:glycosyltransferase family 2 protein [Kordia jejudonensis]
MLLSACIITKNEASNIKSCLESIKDIADEIIILDAFSTDATLEIAKKYTANIYTKEWIHDFSYARNFTISKAKGEWILIIDADEVFTYDSHFASNLTATKTDAFSITRKEIYRQHHDLKQVQFPVHIIRLFRRRTNATFRYPIHERLDDYFIENAIPVSINRHCHLDHHISSNIGFVQSKQKKYLAQIKHYLEKQPTDDWLRYQKIKTLKYFKQHSKALQLIDTFKTKNYKISVATRVIESQIHAENGALDNAIRILKNIPKARNSSIVQMLLGDFYFKKKKFFSALRHYLKLKTSTKTIDFENAMYIVSYCEKKDKVYKIASVLYALKLYFCCILFLNLHKKHLQADSLLLYAFIFLKKDNIPQALLYIKKARVHDPHWKKLIALEKKYDQTI